MAMLQSVAIFFGIGGISVKRDPELESGLKRWLQRQGSNLQPIG